MAANQNDDGSVPPPSTAGLALNIADLNINRENMFLDDPEDSYINTVASATLYASAITFEELNLSPEVIRGLYREMGFKRPSKILAITLPMILSPPYKDLIAQAHNGTGKTTCFWLGMLGRVDPNLRAPQALCICPTRELALQDGFKDDSLRIMMEIGKFSSHCQVNLVVNYDLPIKHEPSHGKWGFPEPDYELYLHRCGRTGCFGGKEAVFNLLCLDWDHLLMENIEKYCNIQVPEVKICEEAFENALRAAGLL